MSNFIQGSTAGISATPATPGNIGKGSGSGAGGLGAGILGTGLDLLTGGVKHGQNLEQDRARHRQRLAEIGATTEGQTELARLYGENDTNSLQTKFKLEKALEGIKQKNDLELVDKETIRSAVAAGNLAPKLNNKGEISEFERLIDPSPFPGRRPPLTGTQAVRVDAINERLKNSVEIFNKAQQKYGMDLEALRRAEPVPDPESETEGFLREGENVILEDGLTGERFSIAKEDISEIRAAQRVLKDGDESRAEFGPSRVPEIKTKKAAPTQESASSGLNLSAAADAARKMAGISAEDMAAFNQEEGKQVLPEYKATLKKLNLEGGKPLTKKNAAKAWDLLPKEAQHAVASWGITSAQLNKWIAILVSSGKIPEGTDSRDAASLIVEMIREDRENNAK